MVRSHHRRSLAHGLLLLLVLRLNVIVRVLLLHVLLDLLLSPLVHLSHHRLRLAHRWGLLLHHGCRLLLHHGLSHRLSHWLLLHGLLHHLLLLRYNLLTPLVHLSHHWRLSLDQRWGLLLHHGLLHHHRLLLHHLLLLRNNLSTPLVHLSHLGVVAHRSDWLRGLHSHGEHLSHLLGVRETTVLLNWLWLHHRSALTRSRAIRSPDRLEMDLSS